MNKWIEELKQLDPKNPGNWPWPFKAGGLLLLFVGLLAAGWFLLFSDQRDELGKEERKGWGASRNNGKWNQQK